MHTYPFHEQLNQNVVPLLHNCKIFGLLYINFLKIDSSTLLKKTLINCHLGMDCSNVMPELFMHQS